MTGSDQDFTVLQMRQKERQLSRHSFGLVAVLTTQDNDMSARMVFDMEKKGVTAGNFKSQCFILQIVQTESDPG